MAIGEIFLGSFFQVLLDKLASMGLEYTHQEGINTTLLQCKGMLETINSVLDDAEDKQLNGDYLVKPWLDDVRDLAYDMEDLLEEFEIEAAQAKSKAESSTSRGQVKRKFSFFSRLRSLVSKTKLQEIKGRFEDIISRKAPLSLREKVVDRSHYTNKRLPSTSLPEPRFFGREKEKAEILKLLTNEAKNADSTLSIFSIIGMGGVGKTALAQQVYNDAKASSYFEKRAWVCVSDVFNVLDITKTILQSITEDPCKDKDLNKIQIKLKDNLYRKKFLVVLDDVWNEKYEEWTSLLKPFEAGAKGSKIIITTRNHPVISITGATPYPLRELSIDNCTSLLAYHALEARNFETHPDLEIVGKKIVEKCRGLPLAVKILGGLLRNKENLDEWEAILNNKIWDIAPGENDEVLPALKLSYVHLPSYLKRCFAYCAVFPNDYEFERDELVLLWIAEGFLNGRKAKENILRSGQKYFDELVSTSFLQQSNIDTSKFLMHDILNDLAKSIADKTCFTSGESQVVSVENDPPFEEKARYASFVSQYVTSKSLRAYATMKIVLMSYRFHHLDSYLHLENYLLKVYMQSLLNSEDWRPYPADQGVRDISRKSGFVLFDSSSKTAFLDADGSVPFFWGIDSGGSLVLSDDAEVVKMGFGKSFAPFPKGKYLFGLLMWLHWSSVHALQCEKMLLHQLWRFVNYEHPPNEVKLVPRVDSSGHVCGATFKVDAETKDSSMPRVGSAAN
ncbi:putative disease resistance RPP13-like protein 1 [Eucalyptus grandis]|uniref:putative disease resistance RPP13-like protein 1 n=1 Tax=Eucalyptus grandis TaxID=71139 RepID=UPI00192EB953|nr:putative disease resistance RPP13-like protein 1 [Eucalyptus grandis]